MGDITIVEHVRCINRQHGRVYYYQGNIYQPLGIDTLELSGVRRAINQFIKKNRQKIKKDRQHPNYRSLSELARGHT